MKIRMKVKTLIWTSLGVLFFIFGVIPFANLELANYLSDKKPTISEKLYDNYLNYPTAFRKDEALYKSSQDIMGGFGRYNIMMGMRLGDKSLDYDTIMKSMDNYKKIIEDYPNSDYYTLAYKGILDIYIYLGDSDNLERWIEWGKLEGKGDTNEISILYNGYNHFINREYHEAEEILKSFTLGKRDLDYIYYFLKGHMEFGREDFDKALEYYQKASNIGWQYRTNFFGSVVPDGRRDWLSSLDFHRGENRIRGRVTSDGVGIPFVEVYLQYKNQGYASRGLDFVAITDKDGYYETIGVKEGRYDLGIGIGTAILFDKAYLGNNIYGIEVKDDVEFNFRFETPMKLISPKPEERVEKDKFKVEWDEIEGADYYVVHAVGIEDGGSVTVAIKDENREYKIKENNAVFDIEKMKNYATGYSFDELISPQAIIGYFYKGVTVPIIVNAYDKDGNILSSSMTMATYYENVPSIKVVGQSTPGEKLILNKEYEKAIEYYEAILAGDRNNIEALSYLARINMMDWKKNKRDIVKAIDYVTRIYDITGETDIMVKMLIQMETKDFKENKEVTANLFQMIAEENRDPDFYWRRGAYYRSIGEFEKAREDLLYSDQDFLNSEIIYIDLYLGENEKALERIKKEDTKFYYMSKNKIIEGIGLLSKLDKNDKDYIVFKEYLSRLLIREEDHEERKEDFNRVYKDIKNPGIRIILNEIKADNHW